jgi:branched-chain amino acid transport system permease protein
MTGLGSLKRELTGFAGLAFTICLLLWLLQGQVFYLDIMALTLIWAFCSCAWNLVGGYQKQLALGHCAFFGIGAYASTLLYVDRGVSPWLGMWLGAIVAAVASALVAWLCFRLKGAFYALATFALAQVLFIVLVSWVGVTNGSGGIAIPYNPGLGNFIFADTSSYVYIFGAATLLVVGATMLLERSRWGLLSLALSSDEEAARALGVHVLRVKLLAGALSGGLTAIAGSFYAQYVLYVDPTSVASFNLSIQISLIAVFGGVATPLGPVVGAAILIPLAHLLSAYLGSGPLGSIIPGLTLVVYGAILIVVLLFVPEGVGRRLSMFVEAGARTVQRLRLQRH